MDEQLEKALQLLDRCLPILAFDINECVKDCNLPEEQKLQELHMDIYELLKENN